MEDNIRSNAGSTTANARDAVRDKAAQVAGMAKERIAGQYDEKKNVALNEVQHFASALRRAGENLRDDGSSSIGATLLTRAAERLDSIGSSMGGKDLDAIVTDVERLARRNPAAFLGGAMLLGFAASRFLKSSGRGFDTADFGRFDVADIPDYSNEFRASSPGIDRPTGFGAGDPSTFGTSGSGGRGSSGDLGGL
jgi:hypothetical protein